MSKIWSKWGKYLVTNTIAKKKNHENRKKNFWKNVFFTEKKNTLRKNFFFSNTSRDKSIDEIQFQIKTKFNDSFEDRCTDGIDFGMYSERPFEWYDTPTEAEN